MNDSQKRLVILKVRIKAQQARFQVDRELPPDLHTVQPKELSLLLDTSVRR